MTICTTNTQTIRLAVEALASAKQTDLFGDGKREPSRADVSFAAGEWQVRIWNDEREYAFVAVQVGRQLELQLVEAS